MSGGNVPYYLRPNKHVERQLFGELLARAIRGRSPDDFVYASMGGRSLEDHKLLHDRLEITQLLSFEVDHTVYGRQLFNRPLGLIECKRMSSGDFVDEFDRLVADYSEDTSFVVWLDYAQAKKQQEQLREFQTLVSKLRSGDIAKITLNAHVDTLGSPAGMRTDERSEHRWSVTKSILGDFLPSSADKKSVSPRGFPKLLAGAVKKACQRALEGSPCLVALPLTVFAYQDVHQMLTVTALVLNEGQVKEEGPDKFLGGWEFRAEAWEDVHRVVVPDLSLRERLKIDSQLFKSEIEEIHARLPFKFDQDPARSEETLAAYAKHYRRYPGFARIAH
jgi:hypothetical protein